MDLIVPLAVKLIAFDDTLREGVIGYLDTFFVRLCVKPNVNFEARSGASVTDARYDNFVRLERHASPIPCYVTEQSMLDFVPFARPRWVVANFDDQSRLIS